MKRILFFLLLLLNLQITIDNGSLNIGLGEVFAQRLQESTITKSYYAATYTCQWCWYPFGYFEDWLKHERKCEYRQEYCPRCDKPTLVRVKDQEQHDNWYHKCSYCCRWMESCICNRCPMCNQNLYLCECDPIEIKGKDKNSNNDNPGFGGGVDDEDIYEENDFGGGYITPSNSGDTGKKAEYKSSKSERVSKLSDAIKKAVEYTKKTEGSKAACNIGVQQVAKYLFGYIPDALKGQANNIILQLRKDKGWQKISRTEAAQYAAEGYLIVAGWYNSSGESGHVVVGNPNSSSNDFKVMDCGPNGVGKHECQGWRYSFGTEKRSKVEYYYYK